MSNDGLVRSVDRVSCGKRQKGKILKQVKNCRTGYMTVGLCAGGEKKLKYVHRLVAEAFVSNPDGKPTVNHKNEDKEDNRASNLEWMTLEENLKYGTHNERAKKNRPDMSGCRHFNYGKRGADSVAHKGRVIGRSVNKTDVVIQFDTAADAARALGLSTGRLCDVLKGRGKSCGGYYWARCDA